MTTPTLAPTPTGLGRQSRKATILVLARFEAGRMLAQPAFLVGLAASLAAILLASGEEAWAGERYYSTMVAWTFTWMGTLAAAALVAGRQRFFSDPDLFPATPATPGDRVLATALALSGPTLVVAGAVTAVALLNVQDGGFLMGEGEYSRAIVPSLAEWAQPVLLVALAGVVGVAVAQRRRGRLAVLGALLFATFVGGSAVWAFQAHPLRVLHPFMYPSYERRLPTSFAPSEWEAGDPPLVTPDGGTHGQGDAIWREVHFDTTALGWHLLYLIGLILVGVWLARRAAERGEPSSARWLGVAGVPLLLFGGVAQVLTAGIAR